MMSSFRFACALLVVSVGCATQAPAPARVDRSSGSELPAAPIEPVRELQRSEVVRVIDRGLGYFLADFGLSPYMPDGHFTGFRVEDIADRNFAARADLRVGDVVLAVNEQPVERPEQAFEAFEALRTAPALKLRMMREGQTLEREWPIVD